MQLAHDAGFVPGVLGQERRWFGSGGRGKSTEFVSNWERGEDGVYDQQRNHGRVSALFILTCPKQF